MRHETFHWPNAETIALTEPTREQVRASLERPRPLRKATPPMSRVQLEDGREYLERADGSRFWTRGWVAAWRARGGRAA